MKKQGPPEPLSEAHYAKLKRKAGLPVEAAAAPESKKRRTAKQPPQKANAAAPKGKGNQAKANGAKAAPAQINAKKEGKRNPKAKVPEPAPESSDDDDMEDLDDDEFSDLDGDEEGGATLGDDFLGSDDSVFDSDQEQDEQQERNKHMFSDDEDDDDGEEALTAANIEGLSRKIEQQAAEEAEDAQAELEEMGLQTNIDEDGPNVLGDEDGKPGASLLAPDLQMLRSRMTDTIRILDDFSKLSEPGRSRADYTAQLIQDICAYYGYSPYLAEKLFNLFPPREAFAFFEANESARYAILFLWWTARP